MSPCERCKVLGQERIEETLVQSPPRDVPRHDVPCPPSHAHRPRQQGTPPPRCLCPLTHGPHSAYIGQKEPPDGVYTLTPGTCEYITLNGKRDTEVIKVMGFTIGSFTQVIRQAQLITWAPFKSREVSLAVVRELQQQEKSERDLRCEKVSRCCRCWFSTARARRQRTQAALGSQKDNLSLVSTCEGLSSDYNLNLVSKQILPRGLQADCGAKHTEHSPTRALQG